MHLFDNVSISSLSSGLHLIRCMTISISVTKCPLTLYGTLHDVHPKIEPASDYVISGQNEQYDKTILT